MKAIKINKGEVKVIDLGTKKIHEYSLPTKLMSVAYMEISGRHPKKGFLYETECAFCLYVTKGKGKIYAGKDVFDVELGDVVYVPIKTKFACEGNMEYVTFDSQGFYPEQSKEVE